MAEPLIIQPMEPPVVAVVVAALVGQVLKVCVMLIVLLAVPPNAAVPSAM